MTTKATPAPHDPRRARPRLACPPIAFPVAAPHFACRTLAALSFSALSLGGAVLMLGACASSGTTPRAADIAASDPSARIAEAWKIAERAESARSLGETEDAARLYAESLGMWDQNSVVWHNYGTVLFELDDRFNAVEAFGRAADLEPTDPRPLTSNGHLYFQNGWADASLDYYERALAIDPNYLPALRGAIRAAEALGRAEPVDLDRIRLALLLERDPKYRAYFIRRQDIVENRIKQR
ncbi:MAG: hypothetical protein AAF235_07960 [Planctomycetota bacterium]